jgi:hypothetical protein
MSNVISVVDYKVQKLMKIKVKKLTMSCLAFKGPEKDRKYKRLLRDIMNAKKVLESSQTSGNELK